MPLGCPVWEETGMGRPQAGWRLAVPVSLVFFFLFFNFLLI